ncbi:hypothetical protein [Spirosoma jeollabukense]
MTANDQIHPYTPIFPPGPASPTLTRTNSKQLYDEKPRKPDWLLLLISALVLLALLIAWAVDIPNLLP